MDRLIATASVFCAQKNPQFRGTREVKRVEAVEVLRELQAPDAADFPFSYRLPLATE